MQLEESRSLRSSSVLGTPNSPESAYLRPECLVWLYLMAFAHLAFWVSRRRLTRSPDE